MAERAAHWLDRVIPDVPVRQWVLTLSWPRRFLLARRPDLCRGALGVFLRTVQGWYRDRARSVLGLDDARTGAVTIIQMAGSGLALNPHFHSLVLDGTYARDPSTGKLEFHRLPAPTTDEVEMLVAEAAARLERWLAKAGFGRDDDGDEGDDEDAQVVMQAASVAGRVALGTRAGRRGRRHQVLGGRTFALPPRCAACDGYNLHAAVVVSAGDRGALERLCRYVCRPPLARTRLEEQPDGTLLLRLKQAWSDGTSSLSFTPFELLEKLAAIIPRPRKNLAFYHGVLGARSAWRTEVVPAPPKEVQPAPGLLRRHPADRPRPSRWWPWASLLWRVFEVDGWLCPMCGARMELRTVALYPPATTRILAGLAAAARSPPDLAATPT